VEIIDKFINSFKYLIFSFGYVDNIADILLNTINNDNFEFFHKYNFITDEEIKELNYFANNYKAIDDYKIKMIIKFIFKRLNLTDEENEYLASKIKDEIENFIGIIETGKYDKYRTFIYILTLMNSIYEIFEFIIIPSNITKIINFKSDENLEKIYNTLNEKKYNIINSEIKIKVNSYFIEKSVKYASYSIKRENLFNNLN